MSTMFKVFVGNLNFKTTEDQLRNIFEAHIEVEDVVIARDPKTDKPMGYGFVMTRDAAKGRLAIRRLGKLFIDGRLIYFKESHGKKKPPRHSSRPRRGQRGGQRPRRGPRSVGGPPGGSSPAPKQEDSSKPDSPPPTPPSGYVGA